MRSYIIIVVVVMNGEHKSHTNCALHF